jgi:peroxiredoxin
LSELGLVSPGGASHYRKISTSFAQDRSGEPRRLQLGASIASLSVIAASGETIAIPDPKRTTHLQLRRFAGCPICNLHLSSFVARREEISGAGLREVIVFHSSTAELRRYAPDVPFALVADPRRRLYRDFGVESSLGALLRPGAWGAMARGPLRAIRSARRGRAAFPLRPSGGRLGLPADFLISSDGDLLAAKYGVHAYDQWSVDELLAHAARGVTPAAS